MIKAYQSGELFIEENKTLLEQNKYLATFFYFDAPLIKEVDINNYMIKVEQTGSILLALRLDPYNLLLLGDASCLDELLSYLKKGKFKDTEILCPTEMGDILVKKYNYQIDKGLDFMETREITSPSSVEVEIPSLEDVDELYTLMLNFLIDCEITDNIDKAKVIKLIDSFRVIKKNGQIISMARFGYGTEDSDRISYVYTRPEFRGLGYARKVVNTVKNEIIQSGRIATLNVDQLNPISNHIYTSLGFRKVFSQGVYRLKEN
ncbi:MAG: GNAT family N-acetyltransferase [Bacilli bacterium]|nr:GNAT family N-acetyltransferase [Bacilli bacterium]